MVSRALPLPSTQSLQAFNRELGATQSTVRGTILPALGLAAAFSILDGSFALSSESALAASSATYGLQNSLYGLRDAIITALLPIIEEIAPALEDAVDWITEMDRKTDGLSTKLGLGAIAAYLFRGQILGLLSALGGGSALLGSAGVALGAAGAGAGYVAEKVADKLEVPRSLITGTDLSLGGPVGLPPVPIDEILQIVGLFNKDAEKSSRDFLIRFGLMNPPFNPSAGQEPVPPTQQTPFGFQPAPIPGVAPVPNAAQQTYFNIPRVTQPQQPQQPFIGPLPNPYGENQQQPFIGPMPIIGPQPIINHTYHINPTIYGQTDPDELIRTLNTLIQQEALQISQGIFGGQ